MLIQVRGISGSGKTTVVRSVLQGLNAQARYEAGRRKPLYYTCEQPRVGILGHYEAVTCGCDTIEGYSRIFGLVKGLHLAGYHVLMEGLLLSDDTKQLLEVQRYPLEDIRVLYLTTPLQDCLDRAQARKVLARTRGRPVDVDNARSRLARVERTRPLLLAKQVYCYRVSPEQACTVIRRWLGCSLRES